MLVRYYQYNRIDPALQHFISRMNEIYYSRYAGRLLNKLLQSPGFDLEEPLKKTVTIMKITGIPVHQHIRGVFRSGLNGLRKDWEFSELACSLIILSSDAGNNVIREMQEELLAFYGAR